MLFIGALKNNRSIYFYVFVVLFLELLSVLAWIYDPLAIFILFFLAIILFIAYRQDKQFLILLPLLELFWGSMGRSIQYEFFSLRWLVFIFTILFFLVINAQNLRNLKIIKNKILGRFFIVYFLLLLLLIVLALINKHSASNIFLDANAYFYFLYLPIWLEYYDEHTLNKLIKILLASALVLAVKTILSFYLFTQSNLELTNYYKWIRDTRTGEITRFGNGFVRIFFQSQIYLLLAWAIIFARAIKYSFTLKKIIYLILLSVAIYISLSRSLWLGFLFVVATIILLNKSKIKSIKYLFILFLASYAFMILLFNFPKYHQFNLLENRSVDSQEASVATRTILWPIMLSSIKERPLFGYGFGKELTFFSQDPRSKNNLNPSGQRTSFSFEWGWLDFMLKGGLLLALFFVYSLFYIIKAYYAIIKSKPEFSPWLAIILALAVIHFFTPYLNHPLGLGLLILGFINVAYYGKNYR